jgi:hypothetical protein
MAERRSTRVKSVLDRGDADRPNDLSGMVARCSQDNRFSRKFSLTSSEGQ